MVERRIGDVIVADEGIGAPVLVVHGGLSDEAPWAKVAAALGDRYRVLRIRRRLYRLELESDPATNLAAEVADVAAVAAFLVDRACWWVTRPAPSSLWRHSWRTRTGSPARCFTSRPWS